MIPAVQREFHNLPPLFLGHRWIQSTVCEYRRGECTLASLGGKKVVFPERQFAGALMHLYLGGFSLAKIAAMTPISLAELAFLRTQIDFMMLVDAAKASFANYFRDNLLLNEYSPLDYASIAAEYSTFEELVRNQIRFPLIGRLMRQAKAISEKDRHSLPMDPCHLRDFKKLFSFFSFEQAFLWNRETDLFGNYEIIARDIVWRNLEEDYHELDLLLSNGLVQHGVKEKLESLFVHF